MNVELVNLGPNCHVVHLGELTLGFSYETVVTFWHIDTGRVISENIWSPTTGKHINMLTSSRKEPRVPHEEFERLLQSVLDRLEMRREVFQ